MARRRPRSPAQPPPHRPHAFPACPPAAPAGRRAPCALRGHGVERRVLGWSWLSVPRPHQIRTVGRSEEHTSELQSRGHLVCRLLLEKKTYKRISSPFLLQ